MLLRRGLDLFLALGVFGYNSGFGVGVISSRDEREEAREGKGGQARQSTSDQ